MSSLFSYAVVQAKLLKTYRPRPNGPNISYILFADPCILIARASIRNASSLKLILDAYCHNSSQMVSISKFYPILYPSTPTQVKETVTSIFQISQRRGVWTYLGVVPIASTRVKGANFNYLIYNLMAKVSQWKRRDLFFAGRVILLHSVLMSIPIYSMSSPNIPCTILNHLEKEMHLVSWDSIYISEVMER